ncbi:MAG: lysophospholipid acyltransferase family protein [Oligoflexales bacterium]
MPAFLRATYFWVIFVVVTVVLFTCLALMCALGLVFRAELSNIVHSVAHIWGKTILFLIPGWSYELSGTENVPRTGQPVVVAANHQSAVDILAALTLNFQFRWLSKASVFKLPLIGIAMRIAGYVPVDRGNPRSHREALNLSAEWIKNGVSMFFFPEGTRSRDGSVRPFKVGAFKLSEETGAPVLPLVLCGTRNMMEKGSGIPQQAHVYIRVLPPEHKKETETVEEFAERVRQNIIAAMGSLESPAQPT